MAPQTESLCSFAFKGQGNVKVSDMFPRIASIARGDRGCNWLTCCSTGLWRVWGALRKSMQGSPSIGMKSSPRLPRAQCCNKSVNCSPSPQGCNAIMEIGSLPSPLLPLTLRTGKTLPESLKTAAFG